MDRVLKGSGYELKTPPLPLNRRHFRVDLAFYPMAPRSGGYDGRRLVLLSTTNCWFYVTLRMNEGPDEGLW